MRVKANNSNNNQVEKISLCSMNDNMSFLQLCLITETLDLNYCK